MSAIYFLFIDNELVYIGQSINVERRLYAHPIAYHTHRIIPCPVDKLLYYEKRLINFFKPKMNRETGGKRKGAGRKPKEPTTTIRVPVSLVEDVKRLIGRLRKEK